MGRLSNQKRGLVDLARSLRGRSGRFEPLATVAGPGVPAQSSKEELCGQLPHNHNGESFSESKDDGQGTEDRSICYSADGDDEGTKLSGWLRVAARPTLPSRLRFKKGHPRYSSERQAGWRKRQRLAATATVARLPGMQKLTTMMWARHNTIGASSNSSNSNSHSKSIDGDSDTDLTSTAATYSLVRDKIPQGAQT